MPKLGMEPIRKAQVISAVLELMARTGLIGLTMDAVAARAGVSKGVVNHYFKGKRDLLLQSFQALLDGYSQPVAQKLASSLAPQEAAQMLRDIARTALTGPDFLVLAESGQPGPDLSASDIGRIMVHFMGLCIQEKDFRRAHAQAYGAWLEGTAAVVQMGIEAGKFKSTDPLAAAYGLFALLDGAALHASVGFCPINLEAVLEVCRTYIDNLILKPPD